MQRRKRYIVGPTDECAEERGNLKRRLLELRDQTREEMQRKDTQFWKSWKKSQKPEVWVDAHGKRWEIDPSLRARVDGVGPNLSAYQERIRRYDELLSQIERMPCKKVRKLGRKLGVKKKTRSKAPKGGKRHTDAQEEFGGVRSELRSGLSQISPIKRNLDSGGFEIGVGPSSASKQAGVKERLGGLRSKKQPQTDSPTVAGKAAQTSSLIGVVAAVEEKTKQTFNSLKIIRMIGKWVGYVGGISTAIDQYQQSKATTQTGRYISAVIMGIGALVVGRTPPGAIFSAIDAVLPNRHKPSYVISKIVDLAVVATEYAVWSGNWGVFGGVGLEPKKQDFSNLDFKPLPPPDWGSKPSRLKPLYR